MHYKQSLSQDKPGCRQYSRAAARSARICELSRSNSEQETSMQNSQGREFRFRVRYPFHRAGDFLEVACININEVFADSPRSIRAAAAMELPGTSKLAAVHVVDSPSQSPVLFIDCREFRGHQNKPKIRILVLWRFSPALSSYPDPKLVFQRKQPDISFNIHTVNAYINIC